MISASSYVRKKIYGVAAGGRLLVDARSTASAEIRSEADEREGRRNTEPLALEAPRGAGCDCGAVFLRREEPRVPGLARTPARVE